MIFVKLPVLFPYTQAVVLTSVILMGLHAGETQAATQQFTLDAAVKRALQQSPAVRIQEAEVDLREGQREQASGEFDWYTNANIARNKNRIPRIDNFARDTVEDSESTDYTFSTTRKLRNGVIIQPSVAVSMYEPGFPVGPAFGSSRLSIQIIVPLLRGLGSASAGAAEAAARGEVEVGRLLYRHALSEQALNTVTAYWQARAAEAAVAVRHDDEKRAKKLHEGIRVLVDTRVFAPNLLLQSEANLRQKSTASRNAELEAQNARFGLARIIGLPPIELVAVPVPSDPLPSTAVNLTLATPADRLRWVERALTRRSDYLASCQSRIPLQILTRQAEIDLKPQLDFIMRGGYDGFDMGRDPLAPISRRLTGANGQIGVSLDWPLANTYQRGLLRSRRAAERKVELTTAQLQSDVAADVCLSLEEVRLRSEMIRDASATVAIAQKAVDQEQRKLQTGQSTVLDVINLENLLSSARLSEIDAQSGFATAVVRLRYSVGAIFTAERTDHSFQLADLTTPPDEK